MGRKSRAWDAVFEAYERGETGYKEQCELEQAVIDYFCEAVYSQFEDIINITEGDDGRPSLVQIGLRLAQREMRKTAEGWCSE